VDLTSGRHIRIERSNSEVSLLTTPSTLLFTAGLMAWALIRGPAR